MDFPRGAEETLLRIIQSRIWTFIADSNLATIKTRLRGLDTNSLNVTRGIEAMFNMFYRKIYQVKYNEKEHEAW